MNDTDNTAEKSELAKKIKQLLFFDITPPISGYDREIYAAYLGRISGWRQKVINWAMSKLPDSILRSDGEVFFTRSSIRNALAHGRGKLKLLSIPHIPRLLQNGVLFHTEKEKNFIFLNYAHPFMFESEKHYAIIVVREDFNGKKFYDNEFITKIKMADGLDYSQGLPATRQKTCAHPSSGTILRNILNVNETKK